MSNLGIVLLCTICIVGIGSAGFCLAALMQYVFEKKPPAFK